MRLIDTSVWIEYFRNTGSDADEYLAEALRDGVGDVVCCEPVAMELLAGTPQGKLAMVEQLLNGLPTVQLDPTLDFRAAAQLHRAVRRTGFTVRSLQDCLIAAAAIRADVQLVHQDVDFELIARVAPLRHLSLRRRSDEAAQ